MSTSTVQKPKAKTIGQNGNVFNILAICSTALKNAGMGDKAKEMSTRVFNSGSYSEALNIMQEYVDMV